MPANLMPSKNFRLDHLTFNSEGSIGMSPGSLLRDRPNYNISFVFVATKK
jgi:hypothetical protein